MADGEGAQEGGAQLSRRQSSRRLRPVAVKAAPPFAILRMDLSYNHRSLDLFSHQLDLLLLIDDTAKSRPRT